MNKRFDGKIDITFELKTVENIRRSIKEKMSQFTCTVLSTLLFTTLSHRWIDDVVLIDDMALTNDVALTDKVSRSY